MFSLQPEFKSGNYHFSQKKLRYICIFFGLSKYYWFHFKLILIRKTCKKNRYIFSEFNNKFNRIDINKKCLTWKFVLKSTLYERRSLKLLNWGSHYSWHWVLHKSMIGYLLTTLHSICCYVGCRFIKKFAGCLIIIWMIFKKGCGIQMSPATPTKFSMLFKHTYSKLLKFGCQSFNFFFVYGLAVLHDQGYWRP